MTRKIVNIQTGEVTIDETFNPTVDLEQEKVHQRAEAEISRLMFCIALYRARILSADEAEGAARGEWPQAFNAAFEGMDADAVTEAKITWAALTSIPRNSPLLVPVAMQTDMSDIEIDALFGI